MTRKTTKVAKVAIEKRHARMKWVSEMLYAKRNLPAESLMSFVRDKTEDYWIGLADGANAALEEILFDQDCYAGYCTIEFKGEQWQRVHSSNTDGWCRLYFTRGV